MSIDINKQVKEITYNGIPLDLGGTGGSGGTGGALVPFGGFVPETLDSEGNIASGTWYGEKIPYNKFDGNLSSWWRKLVTVNLPDNLTRIYKNAFYLCESLVLTSLPNTITTIDENAFYFCENLALTSLPNSLTYIGGSAFYNCSNLRSLIIPASVTGIYSHAFSNCSGLTTVTFKGTPTSLGASFSGSYKVFSSCPNLTKINVPWSLGEVAGAPWGATNATINYNYTG